MKTGTGLKSRLINKAVTYAKSKGYGTNRVPPPSSLVKTSLVACACDSYKSSCRCSSIEWVTCCVFFAFTTHVRKDETKFLLYLYA
jgi:hypothetical protein